MTTSTCTVCGMPLIGHPDDDVTCPDCERQNFAGDLLRYPPQRVPSWLLGQGQPAVEAYITYNPREWNPSQGGMPPRRDGLRALARAEGWRWSPDRGDTC